MKELRPRKINDIKEWNIFKQALKDRGYTIFQMQYDVNHPEGFHVWFIHKDKSVELITYNKKIRDDIYSV